MSLTFKAHDLQPADRSMFFEVVEGLANVVEVRGADTIVPRLAGRIEQPRVLDVLPIVLAGWVKGIGATDAAKASSFAVTLKTLRGWFDPTDAGGALVASLNDGTTATVTAVARDLIPGALTTSRFRRFSIELEAFADWVVT